MKILLTGVPGWLGDAVLSAIDADHDVTCLLHSSLPASALDLWLRTKPESRKKVHGDVSNPVDRANFLADASGSVLLHSAAVIHPKRTQEWYTINRDATVSLARDARAAGVRRFVFVSSNAAQGATANNKMVMDESMPCHPLSHYGISKYQAELELMKLHEDGKFEVVIVRPCMFYGPPVPGRHVGIFKRIMAGRMPIVGTGDFARSLSFIDDLVNGVLLCMTKPAASGQVFYLCDATPYSTREVCEAMAAALGVRSKFIKLPTVTAKAAYLIDKTLSAAGIYSMNFHLLGEANWNVACTSEKASRLLGYKTTVDVWEGYRRSVAWCRENHLI